MKLTHIVESRQQLIEQHKHNGLMLLVESTYGLDRNQQQVVENVYKHFLPLIEASLSKDQIQQIFTNVEQGATAAGGNRTAIGKSKDVVEKVNKIINDAGKWLQDTTPVKNFDAKFEKLKNDINKKFPDSKILDGISNMAMWAEKNPGKTAAIVGILTAIASLAGGPIGGAIAGQVLRGTVELLKGEKLSTAIGKGIKTAAFGFLSGKAFEMLGEFAEGMRIKSIPFGPEDAGLEQISYGASKTISSPGMEWTREIQGVNITVDPEMASAIRSANNLLTMGGDAANEGFEQLQNVAEIINSQEYRQEMAAVWKGAFEATKNNDSLLKFITAAKEGLQAVSQGAVAAAGVAGDGKSQPAKQESVKHSGRKLSEGQVYMLFKRVDVAQDFLAEAGLLSKVGGAIKGAAGKLGQKITTTGKNLTTKVTADKLNSAWQKAGSPTDSEEVFDFLTQQGVNKEVIAPVYDTMKLPVPKSAAQAEPADDKQAATGQKLNPAAAEPEQEPKPGTVGLQTQPGETPQGQSASAASGDKAAAQDEPAADQPANKPVDVIALANEIKASDPNITGDVKKLLDDDLKLSQKQQAKPAVDQTQPAPTTA
jgi:hypothetical protein